MKDKLFKDFFTRQSPLTHAELRDLIDTVFGMRVLPGKNAKLFGRLVADWYRAQNVRQVSLDVLAWFLARERDDKEFPMVKLTDALASMEPEDEDEDIRGLA